MTTNIHNFPLSNIHRTEMAKFGLKALNDKQKYAIAKINEATQNLMEIIYMLSPSTPDQSAAIRSARLAAMQANASVVWDWPGDVA